MKSPANILALLLWTMVPVLCACDDGDKGTTDAGVAADAATHDGPTGDDATLVPDSAVPDSGADGAGDALPTDGPAEDTAVDSLAADSLAVDSLAADSLAADSLAADSLAADSTPCQKVQLTFQGTVATVAGSPVGLTGAAYNKPASGELAYLLCVPDSKAADAQRGRYDHGSGGEFELTVETASIVGSSMPVVTIEDLGSDTFRWEDGKLPIDTKTRTMTLNGTAAPDLYVWIAITDSSGNAWSSDAAPATFPFTSIASYPHTFSVKDAGGTLLLQLTSITQL